MSFPGLPSLPGLPDLSSVLGGGGGLPGMGLHKLFGMGDGQQQGQGASLGGTMQTSNPYMGNTPDSSGATGGAGDGWNLQALLDMMNMNQQSQGGGQSYIGGQGLI